MQPDTSINHIQLQARLSSIKNNDEKALKLLYQTNYLKVEKYVLENSGTTDEAKDIYQDAFIALWRNIQLNKFQPGHETSLDGYLYQIAKNKWLDHLRSVKRSPLVALTDTENGVEEVNVLSEEEEQLLGNIKANFKLLGQQCRDVLDRFYFQKQSMRTIAEALQWTEATAKNNKYRCLQQLRKLLTSNTSDRG